MKLSLRTALPALLVLTIAGLTGCQGDPPVDPNQPTTTVGAGGQAVGSMALGTTNYPIPGAAMFVSNSGSDSAPGSQAQPLRSVVRAVALAPPNTTIVIRGGTYRERVDIPSTKRLTLQSYPGEAVWFSGSTPVTGWVSDGGDWRKDNWTAQFSRDGLDASMQIGADPRAGYPDMAFIDGQPLAQVASKSAVVPGTFYVDEAADQLFIGSDPAGHTVEGSVLSEALNVQSAGSIIRGIGFEHYATDIQDAGAVRGWNNVLFENDIFTENASGGLSLRGDVTARRVTATYNGQLGIAGYHSNGATIENSVISFNNTDHFNPESATGGVKVFLSPYVTMRGNIANDNYGHALWFDGHSDHAIAVRNITRRNARGAGVMFEISDDAIIAGNISTDNEAGLQSGESSDVKVWNNTVVNNEYAFSAYQGTRALPVNIQIRNNILGAGPMSDRPVLINFDVTKTRSWRDMAWTSNFNAIYRQSTTVTREATVMANWPSGNLSFTTKSQISAATSQEMNSMAVDNTPSDPYVTDVDGGDFRPRTPVINQGTPLPTDVATAMGKPAGVQVNIGAPIG